VSDEDRQPREGLLLPVVIPLGALAFVGLVLFGFSRILLGISHDAATVTALVVAATIVGAAGIVAAQKRVGPSALGSMLGVVAGVALMTGSLAYLIVGPQKEAVQPAVVTLAAGPKASSEGFDPTTLAFPAGRAVNLEFDNQEPSVTHNVVIYSKDPADNPGQTALFTGQPVTGPNKATYAVKPLAEGTYFFICEFHPTTMQGQIDATKGGAAPGPTVVAKSLQFDTKEIDLPAQTPTAITFHNEDAGVTHNIAIFQDEKLGTPLFDGPDVLGVATATYDVPGLDAGTYYFHCDTHPSMNGSVVVSGGGGGGGSPPPTSPPPTTPPPTPPAGGGGGGTATASISASGLSFSTDSLSFPADTGVSFTFDNQDAGVLHNVDFFSDAAYTQSVFKGPDVTGPSTATFEVPPLSAATYYYRCDYHPTMTGTVAVT
jgi:plastocyanin